MAYQERWVRGATVEQGDRSCADRYALIRPFLQAYQRQFTVWDLGANLGYFGHRIADEFGAVSVMVDARPVLADVCRENALPTTIAMTHHLTAADLHELAQSEHADVVLALNVIHHMADWREALLAILALGETVIIETPGLDDVESAHYQRSQDILMALSHLGLKMIGYSHSHVTPGVMRPMLIWKRPKASVSSGYAYVERVRARGRHPVRPHTIHSTLGEKQIHFDGAQSRVWHHGMNLWNWLQMGGSYPDRSTVQQQARSVAASLAESHGDFKPWNLILQGQTVQAIDSGHRRSVDDAKGLADTLAWIATPELAYAN
jgi:hypothetical protein